MAPIQYLNLEFDEVKQSIKDYLKSNSNFTDYDFEGSNMSILIDILAYNTYINSYNTNMVANESFLHSASIRENVISHAENIGYVPRSSRSARAKISFNLTFDINNLPSFITLSKGIVATTNLISSTNIFSIPEDVTVPVSNLKAIFSEVEIFEGNLITQEFTVDNSLKDQKFILDNLNIDTTTISVKVKDSAQSQIYDKFDLVDNIIGATSDKNIFIVKEYRDQRYELVFGDGFIGKKLETGNIVEVSYIVCNESDGNGIQNFVINGRFTDDSGNIIPLSGIVPTVDQPSLGGSEIESVDSIKKYASRYLSTQNRAVTTSDYETLIPKLFPKAESAVAYGGETLNPPQYGKVFVSIKPDNFSFLSLFDKNFIKNELKKYSPVGIDVIIEDLKYLNIELNVNVYYNSRFTDSPDSIRSKIFNNISNYSKIEDLTRFGGRFKYSNFTSMIDNTDVSVMSNITNVVLMREIVPEFNSYFSYELCFGNTLFNPVGSSYNIRSTGFTIDKYTDILYLTDVVTDNINGRLVLFKIGQDNLPEIVESNVGKVNYSNGELFIDSLNITSTILSNKIIEVECLPNSYDVLGLRDLFLNISVNNSNVNMIRDDISSGSDASGVTYQATPQYNKQGFYRIK